jgi:hypothetical protein
MRPNIQLDESHFLTDSGIGDYELVCRVAGQRYFVPRVGEKAFIRKERSCPLCYRRFQPESSGKDSP